MTNTERNREIANEIVRTLVSWPHHWFEKTAIAASETLTGAIHQALDAAEERGIEDGAKGVLRIRCTKHFNVEQLNSNEFSGGECGACVAEQLKEATINEWKAAQPEPTRECGEMHIGVVLKGIL